jgi:hypothetical protein
MSKRYEAEDILIAWAKEFHDCGDHDDGICIVHDGYATNDDDEEDENKPCYAIFVRLDSFTKKFPPHDTTHGMIIHRPNEEAHFSVWLDLETDESQEINEPDHVNVDLENIYKIIIKIEKRYRND